MRSLKFNLSEKDFEDVFAPCIPVDIEESGEGALEISIGGPSGTNIQNNVTQISPGRFEVGFTPQEGGKHNANVQFNKEHIPGGGYKWMGG